MPHTRDGAGRYVATEPLGEGGTAEVWRAWDRHAETWCALKVLFERFAQMRAARRRFIDEGRTVMKLRHRNVIDAWDLVEDAAQPFLVMEIAEGGSLKDWVDRYGRMAPRIAVDATIQISKGIAAAHALGVVHRDIKPHNILLTRRGLCKVTDFGIAQIIRDDGTASIPDWTQTMPESSRKAVGTLGYMAPEQRSDGYLADVRTDIYGIGATLYTLLTGRVVTNLFIAERDPELLEGIDEELVPVIVQATTFKPENRYGSVKQLARALFDLRDHLPEVAPGAPGLSPDLPPAPIGPYEATRNTWPTDPPTSSSSSGLTSAPPAPGSFPPGSFPPAPAPTDHGAVRVAPSVAPGPPPVPHGLTPTSRSQRARSGLILTDTRIPRVDGQEVARTRPLVVISVLVGIFVSLLSLDAVRVNLAHTDVRQATSLYHRAVERSGLAVEALGNDEVEERWQEAMQTYAPLASMDAGERYLDVLQVAERQATLSNKARVDVRRAVNDVERRHQSLVERIEVWERRAEVLGLAVSVGLSRAPSR